MVLFRDDELRLIAAERAAEPRWKKRLRLASKIVFWIGALFVASLFVLSSLAGKGAPLKHGIEEYLRQATGYDAEIRTLNYMSFYPVVGVDFDNLTLYRQTLQKDEAAGGKPARHPMMVRGDRVAAVGHVTAVIGFWDLFFSRHWVRQLNMTDIDIASDVIDQRQVAADYIRLDPKGPDGKPAIVLQGHYGDEILSGAVEMAPRRLAFSLPDDAHFNIKAGKLEARGTMAHRFGRGLVLTVAQAGLPSKLAEGTMILSMQHRLFKLDLDLHAGSSRVTAALERHNGGAFKGKIDVPALDVADIRPLTVFLTALAEYWPFAPSLQARLTLGRLADGAATLGHGAAQLTLADGELNLDSITGALDKAPAGKTWHLSGQGLDLALPYDPPVTCLSAKMEAGKLLTKIGPAVAAGGQAAYDGHGSIGLTGEQRVALAFKPAAKPAAGCTLP